MDDKHNEGACPSVDLTKIPESQRQPDSSVMIESTEESEGNKKQSMEQADEKHGGGQPSLRLTRRPRQEPDVPSIIDQIMDDFVVNY